MREMILGLPVDQITYEDILTDVPKFLEGNQKMSIISVNPQIALEANKYPSVIDLLAKSTHRIPDGIGVVLVSKMTGGKIKERVAGFDLMVKLLEYANKTQKKCFFYGAKPEILQDAIKNIQKDYPNLIVSGSIDGYTKMDDHEIVAAMNKVKPDFIFVALGFPRQELWLTENMGSVNAHVFQDVGGSFDVLSGHVKRAPDFFIKTHLEWLYRSLSNPTRIGRIVQLPIFVVKSLWWKMRNGGRD